MKRFARLNFNLLTTVVFLFRRKVAENDTDHCYILSSVKGTTYLMRKRVDIFITNFIGSFTKKRYIIGKRHDKFELALLLSPHYL